MYLGRIVEVGPTKQVLTEPLHPYTRALLSVVPDGGGEPAAAPGGRAPRPDAHPGRLSVPSTVPRAGRRTRQQRPGSSDACASADPSLERWTEADHLAACHLAVRVCATVRVGYPDDGRHRAPGVPELAGHVARSAAAVSTSTSRTSGTCKTEEMILNIGPQHPSTHGVLRVVLELDGEVITRAEPVIGYMHRAAEKLAEYRDARQIAGADEPSRLDQRVQQRARIRRSPSSASPASRFPSARGGSARCSPSGTAS